MSEIIFNIATVQRRRESFLKVLAALASQTIKCDKINIAMSYDAPDKEIESFVNANFKANEIIYGKFSAMYKMFSLDKCPDDSYFFTFDDDIGYPDKYTSSLLSGINKYSEAMVGFHGMKFRTFPIYDIKKQRVMFQYFNSVGCDMIVDVLGSGVAGFYVGSLRKKGFTFDLFLKNEEYGNYNDIIASNFCRKNKIPMYVLAHNSKSINILPQGQEPEALYKIAAISGRQIEAKLLNL